MLIITFDVFAVSLGIASGRNIFVLSSTISFGRQWATAQPVPLVLRVVVFFYWSFLLLFHDNHIYVPRS